VVERGWCIEIVVCPTLAPTDLCAPQLSLAAVALFSSHNLVVTVSDCKINSVLPASPPKQDPENYTNSSINDKLLEFKGRFPRS
jgi:hypothetical protein